MVKIGAHGIEIYRTSRAIGSQKANRPPAGGLFSDTAPRTERRDYPVPWRGLEAPGGTRSKNGVASLAYDEFALRRRAADALRRDQGSEALAGIEHAGLNGVLRDAEDLDDLLDRLLLVINQVDDLGVLGRELLEAAADDGAAVLEADLGLRVGTRVGRILRHVAVQRLGGAAVGSGERLVAGDAEQPGRAAGATLEAIGVLPGVDEGFAHRVLGERRVAHDAKREAIDLHLMAREQRAHRKLIAVGDLLDQRLIGNPGIR